MVSFDVKSLFTNIEALEVVNRRLNEDDTVMERTVLPPALVTHLLQLYLRTIYFKFQRSYYEQTDGAAIASPVSPVVANIYMEMFEELALRTAEHPPRIWRRYVDDTFCVMKKTDVEGFLDHLNSIRPTISFIMEQEEDGKLPFLDTLLDYKSDGSLDVSIYRKPTHTNRYLHFSSHHPRHVKEGVVSCLFHQAGMVAQGENVAAEEHLRGVLEGNGYPETFVKTASKPRRAAEPTEEPRATAFIPYVSSDHHPPFGGS